MFFALFVVVGLSGFHCYLASTNQTTYEMIKPQVAEKWKDEERKRRKIYFNHNKDDADIDEDNYSEPDGETPRPRHLRAEPVSFDKGFLENTIMFWTGNLKQEWQIPYPCVLKDSDTEESE
eukprot:UN06620